MQEKWTHRAVGAGIGAIVMLFALPFCAGWYTAGGAKSLASEAVTNALLPVCVEAVPGMHAWHRNYLVEEI